MFPYMIHTDPYIETRRISNSDVSLFLSVDGDTTWTHESPLFQLN